MTSSDKNARAAWATLTHDSLNNAHVDKHSLTRVQFFFLNVGLLLGNILVLFNTGAFASVTLHATGDLGVSPSHAGWMQTYYFICLALALPISSWLAAAVGEVRLYLAAMIAMMLIAKPDLLIADEPTSALDVTVQLQVLAILDKLVVQRGMGLIFISHDLRLVSTFCDRILVMYAGRVVEEISAGGLADAKHPYTRGLLNCLPRLGEDRHPLPTLERQADWAL